MKEVTGKDVKPRSQSKRAMLKIYARGHVAEPLWRYTLASDQVCSKGADQCACNKRHQDSIPLEKVMSRPFRMEVTPVGKGGPPGSGPKRARMDSVSLSSASSSSASSSSASSSSAAAATEEEGEVQAKFEYFMPPGVLQEAEAWLAADAKKFNAAAFV